MHEARYGLTPAAALFRDALSGYAADTLTVDVADVAAGRGVRPDDGLPVLRDIELKSRELAAVGAYELRVAMMGTLLGPSALACAEHAPEEAQARLGHLGHLW